MLQDEILPKIQKTLKIFNDIEVGGKLTAEMMWFLQDDMKFWTWMGADENGDDIQEWDMQDGVAYVNRGREEAARCYRSATRKGAEGVWKMVGMVTWREGVGGRSICLCRMGSWKGGRRR